MMRRSLILLALLSACSVLPDRPYQARREWPLTVDPLPASAVHPAAGIVLLRDVEAGPGLEQRGLQRVRPDGTLDVSYWDEWAVPPADGVDAVLRNYLEQSGLFSAITAPGSRLDADLVVDARLDSFVCESDHALAAMTVVVTRHGHVMGQTYIETKAPLTNPSPQAEVAALRSALAAALPKIADFIVKASQTGR